MRLSPISVKRFQPVVLRLQHDVCDFRNSSTCGIETAHIPRLDVCLVASLPDATWTAVLAPFHRLYRERTTARHVEVQGSLQLGSDRPGRGSKGSGTVTKQLFFLHKSLRSANCLCGGSGVPYRKRAMTTWHTFVLPRQHEHRAVSAQ